MHVRVIDPAAAQPYRLGVELLIALQGREEFKWGQDGASLTRLVGTPRLLDDLRQGMTAEQILAGARGSVLVVKAPGDVPPIER